MKRYQPEPEPNKEAAAYGILYGLFCAAAFYATAGAVIYIGRMFT